MAGQPGSELHSREASFLGEIAWNTRTKVTKNEATLNPNADKSATAVRHGLCAVLSPGACRASTSRPASASATPGATLRQWATAFGVNKGGDFNIGVTGTYLGRWIASLNYVHYLGPVGTSVDDNTNVQFKQSLKDRNFVTFSLRTTF